MYEVQKYGMGNFKELLFRYIAAFPTANEYMIGVLWFLVTLFWCALLILLLKKLNGIEIFGLLYLVLWVLWLRGELVIPGNTNLFPVQSVFMYLKYILMGYVIGKYKDFMRQDRLYVLWHITGIFGLVGYVYKGIQYHTYMVETDASVVGFASYYIDFIIFWIIMWALRHPMHNLPSWLGMFMENTSLLLFFGQRIAIDYVRIMYKRVIPTGECTWGKLYILVLLILCMMGMLLTLLKKNQKIKKLCYWIV